MTVEYLDFSTAWFWGIYLEAGLSYRPLGAKGYTYQQRGGLHQGEFGHHFLYFLLFLDMLFYHNCHYSHDLTIVLLLEYLTLLSCSLSFLPSIQPLCNFQNALCKTQIFSYYYRQYVNFLVWENLSSPAYLHSLSCHFFLPRQRS